MADTTLVEVLDATDEFIVEFRSLLLIQARISDNEIEQLATVGMLHNHEEFLLSLDNLLEMHSGS